ncbi:MAG: hypothetical protein E7070_11540 [Bacteroidales bacterium]|jgi:predicted restriction endonuclease|nr:hypothetical protein [Bacteroidales bacterium]
MISYIENEPEFYQYLTLYGGINIHSRTNYMAWLKFLSKSYTIDELLTEDKIEKIVQKESQLQTQRNIYTKARDLVNFKSALRKYISFVQSDYSRIQSQTILSEINKIENNNDINETEKQSIVKSRIGQGLFRNRLFEYWGGCSISKCKFINILIASHIKPWIVSDNNERVSTYNGLLLLPNYDKLFDKGYISFSDNGKIIISKFFPNDDLRLLGIKETTQLVKIDERHLPFFKYHRENCFIQ